MLADRLPPRTGVTPDEILDLFLGHVRELGLALYPAQEQAIVELLTGSNVILATPTGSGEVACRGGLSLRGALRPKAQHLHGADQGAREREVLCALP